MPVSHGVHEVTRGHAMPDCTVKYWSAWRHALRTVCMVGNYDEARCGVHEDRRLHNGCAMEAFNCSQYQVCDGHVAQSMHPISSGLSSGPVHASHQFTLRQWLRPCTPSVCAKAVAQSMHSISLR
eukprot:1149404-Pelagomonas_calceolata.AAC.1